MGLKASYYGVDRKLRLKDGLQPESLPQSGWKAWSSTIGDHQAVQKRPGGNSRIS